MSQYVRQRISFAVILVSKCVGIRQRSLETKETGGAALSPTGRWGGDTKAQVTTKVEHENIHNTHTHTHTDLIQAHTRSSVSRLKTIKQNARTKHAKTKPLLIPSAPCGCCPSSLFSFQSQISEESSPAASTALPLASALPPLTGHAPQARSSLRPAGTTLRLLVSFSALEPDSRVSST